MQKLRDLNVLKHRGIFAHLPLVHTPLVFRCSSVAAPEVSSVAIDDPLQETMAEAHGKGVGK